MDIIDILWKYTESVHSTGRKRVRMGSVLVYKKRIIAFGMNRIKSHPMQLQFNEYPFLHSEVDCIIRALKHIDIDKLPYCNLFTLRLKYENSNRDKLIMGSAKPCKGCSKFLAYFNISNINYSTDQQYMEKYNYD